ncbi:MAG: hypothetical protein HOC74_23185 [Gemmatimonadetes bacterium]|nr:hypothetical protein [Gemmatimonadota bacterium]
MPALQRAAAWAELLRRAAAFHEAGHAVIARDYDEYKGEVWVDSEWGGEASISGNSN